MKDWVPVLVSVAAGTFALLGTFLGWWFKRMDEARARHVQLGIERRKELVDLYAQVFSSLEQAMASAFDQSSYELSPERTLVNAKVRLLGSHSVNLAYDDVADKLRNWSELQVAASPQKVHFGDQTATLFQTPDPTEKFKPLAKEAHGKLHVALQSLRESMREELEAVSKS